MCGITIYAGKEPITFYEALKRTPYWRGGDGLGVMWLEDGKIRVQKSAGAVENYLKVILGTRETFYSTDKFTLPPLEATSTFWLIHNRKGTVGSSYDTKNNHPHFLKEYGVWVLQNGTVVGLDFYRGLLEMAGVKFNSATDTEVLGHAAVQHIIPKIQEICGKAEDKYKAVEEFLEPFAKATAGFGVFVVVDPENKQVHVLKDDDRTLWLSRDNTGGVWLTSEIVVPIQNGKLFSTEIYNGYIRLDLNQADFTETAYYYAQRCEDLWKVIRQAKPVEMTHTSCDACREERLVFKCAEFDICWECIADNKNKPDFGVSFRGTSEWDGGKWSDPTLAYHKTHSKDGATPSIIDFSGAKKFTDYKTGKPDDPIISPVKELDIWTRSVEQMANKMELLIQRGCEEERDCE